MFVCAGNGEEFGFAQSIGVGLTQSAMKLTKLCQSNPIDCLIFVGSAGSYDLNLTLLDVYCAFESVQIESSFLDSCSYTPIALSQSSVDVSHETIDQIRSLHLPQAVVNSSNYITTDRRIGSKMQERGILLENMEFFSVLSVAKEFHLPAMGVFCVSNYCDIYAHQEFLQNRFDVISKLSRFYEMLQSEH